MNLHQTSYSLRMRRNARSGISALLVSTMLFSSLQFGFIMPAFANPSGGQVVGGSASISGEGTKSVTVQQTSNRAAINWNNFSIVAGEKTTFVQPGKNAVILNRVTGASPSEIFGSMEANGKVILSNKNGVLFGAGSKIDAAGLVATTHDADTAAFMGGGPLRFTGGMPGSSVVNEGTISVKDAGVAALVAPHVRNTGVIVANKGKAALGAGNGFTLDFYGDKLISFNVGDDVAETLTTADGTPLKALVENSGTISAADGQIVLTAAVARGIVNQSVNVQGKLMANSATTRGGNIILSANNGEVVVDGGHLSATGATSGGAAHVLGEHVRLENATIDVSGDKGGGIVRVGGGYQGGEGLQRATTTRVDAKTKIKADARKKGKGGDVVVWSDSYTGYQGHLSARGGAQGGDGGNAEVSGKRLLDFSGTVDLLAPKGKAGSLLLDPRNIVIQIAGPDGVDCSGTPLCVPTGDDSVLTVATLEAALSAGNVILTTEDSGGGQHGDILFVDSVTWNTPHLLMVRADRSIEIGSGATISNTYNTDPSALPEIPVLLGLWAGATNYNDAELNITGSVDFSNSLGAVSAFIGQGGHMLNNFTGNGSWDKPANQSLSNQFTVYQQIRNVAGLYNALDSATGDTWALVANIDGSGGAWNGNAALNGLDAGGILDGQLCFLMGGSVCGIGNFTLNSAAPNITAPFAQNSGILRNLFVDINVNGASELVGGLVATNTVNGMIANVTTAGTVINTALFGTDYSAFTGGLAAVNEGAIYSSRAEGNVSFVMRDKVVDIVDCGGMQCDGFSPSTAVGQYGTVEAFTGGLVGFNYANTSSIFDSVATGNVSSIYDVQYFAFLSNGYGAGNLLGAMSGATYLPLTMATGGLVGANLGLIEGSRAEGNVTTRYTFEAGAGLSDWGASQNNINGFFTDNTWSNIWLYAGGLVGVNGMETIGEGYIRDSIALGNVNAATYFIFQAEASGSNYFPEDDLKDMYNRNRWQNLQSWAGGLVGYSHGELSNVSAQGSNVDNEVMWFSSITVGDIVMDVSGLNSFDRRSVTEIYNSNTWDGISAGTGGVAGYASAPLGMPYATLTSAQSLVGNASLWISWDLGLSMNKISILDNGAGSGVLSFASSLWQANAVNAVEANAGGLIGRAKLTSISADGPLTVDTNIRTSFSWRQMAQFDDISINVASAGSNWNIGIGQGMMTDSVWGNDLDQLGQNIFYTGGVVGYLSHEDAFGMPAGTGLLNAHSTGEISVSAGSAQEILFKNITIDLSGNNNALDYFSGYKSILNNSFKFGAFTGGLAGYIETTNGSAAAIIEDSGFIGTIEVNAFNSTQIQFGNLTFSIDGDGSRLAANVADQVSHYVVGSAVSLFTGGLAGALAGTGARSIQNASAQGPITINNIWYINADIDDVKVDENGSGNALELLIGNDLVIGCRGDNGAGGCSGNDVYLRSFTGGLVGNTRLASQGTVYGGQYEGDISVSNSIQSFFGLGDVAVDTDGVDGTINLTVAKDVLTGLKIAAELDTGGLVGAVEDEGTIDDGHFIGSIRVQNKFDTDARIGNLSYDVSGSTPNANHTLVVAYNILSFNDFSGNLATGGLAGSVVPASLSVTPKNITNSSFIGSIDSALTRQMSISLGLLSSTFNDAVSTNSYLDYGYAAGSNNILGGNAFTGGLVGEIGNYLITSSFVDATSYIQHATRIAGNVDFKGRVQNFTGLSDSNQTASMFAGNIFSANNSDVRAYTGGIAGRASNLTLQGVINDGMVVSDGNVRYSIIQTGSSELNLSGTNNRVSDLLLQGVIASNSDLRYLYTGGLVGYLDGQGTANLDGNTYRGTQILSAAGWTSELILGDYLINIDGSTNANIEAYLATQSIQGNASIGFLHTGGLAGYIDNASIAGNTVESNGAIENVFTVSNTLASGQMTVLADSGSGAIVSAYMSDIIRDGYVEADLYSGGLVGKMERGDILFGNTVAANSLLVVGSNTEIVREAALPVFSVGIYGDSVGEFNLCLGCNIIYNPYDSISSRVGGLVGYLFGTVAAGNVFGNSLSVNDSSVQNNVTSRATAVLTAPAYPMVAISGNDNKLWMEIGTGLMSNGVGQYNLATGGLVGELNVLNFTANVVTDSQAWARVAANLDVTRELASDPGLFSVIGSGNQLTLNYASDIGSSVANYGYLYTGGLIGSMGDINSGNPPPGYLVSLLNGDGGVSASVNYTQNFFVNDTALLIDGDTNVVDFTGGSTIASGSNPVFYLKTGGLVGYMWRSGAFSEGLLFGESLAYSGAVESAVSYDEGLRLGETLLGVEGQGNGVTSKWASNYYSGYFGGENFAGGLVGEALGALTSAVYNGPQVRAATEQTVRLWLVQPRNISVLGDSNQVTHVLAESSIENVMGEFTVAAGGLAGRARQVSGSSTGNVVAQNAHVFLIGHGDYSGMPSKDAVTVGGNGSILTEEAYKNALRKNNVKVDTFAGGLAGIISREGFSNGVNCTGGGGCGLEGTSAAGSVESEALVGFRLLVAPVERMIDNGGTIISNYAESALNGNAQNVRAFAGGLVGDSVGTIYGGTYSGVVAATASAYERITSLGTEADWVYQLNSGSFNGTYGLRSLTEGNMDVQTFAGGLAGRMRAVVGTDPVGIENSEYTTGSVYARTDASREFLVHGGAVNVTDSNFSLSLAQAAQATNVNTLASYAGGLVGYLSSNGGLASITNAAVNAGEVYAGTIYGASINMMNGFSIKATSSSTDFIVGKDSLAKDQDDLRAYAGGLAGSVDAAQIGSPYGTTQTVTLSGDVTGNIGYGREIYLAGFDAGIIGGNARFYLGNGALGRMTDPSSSTLASFSVYAGGLVGDAHTSTIAAYETAIGGVKGQLEADIRAESGVVSLSAVTTGAGILMHLLSDTLNYQDLSSEMYVGGLAGSAQDISNAAAATVGEVSARKTIRSTVASGDVVLDLQSDSNTVELITQSDVLNHLTGTHESYVGGAAGIAHMSLSNVQARSAAVLGIDRVFVNAVLGNFNATVPGYGNTVNYNAALNAGNWGVLTQRNRVGGLTGLFNTTGALTSLQGDVTTTQVMADTVFSDIVDFGGSNTVTITGDGNTFSRYIGNGNLSFGTLSQQVYAGGIAGLDLLGLGLNGTVQNDGVDPVSVSGAAAYEYMFYNRTDVLQVIGAGTNILGKSWSDNIVFGSGQGVDGGITVDLRVGGLAGAAQSITSGSFADAAVSAQAYGVLSGNVIREQMDISAGGSNSLNTSFGEDNIRGKIGGAVSDQGVQYNVMAGGLVGEAVHVGSAYIGKNTAASVDGAVYHQRSMDINGSDVYVTASGNAIVYNEGRNNLRDSNVAFAVSVGGIAGQITGTLAGAEVGAGMNSVNLFIESIDRMAFSGVYNLQSAGGNNFTLVLGENIFDGVKSEISACVGGLVGCSSGVYGSSQGKFEGGDVMGAINVNSILDLGKLNVVSGGLDTFNIRSGVRDMVLTPAGMNVTADLYVGGLFGLSAGPLSGTFAGRDVLANAEYSYVIENRGGYVELNGGSTAQAQIADGAYYGLNGDTAIYAGGLVGYLGGISMYGAGLSGAFEGRDVKAVSEWTQDIRISDDWYIYAFGPGNSIGYDIGQNNFQGVDPGWGRTISAEVYAGGLVGQGENAAIADSAYEGRDVTAQGRLLQKLRMQYLLAFDVRDMNQNISFNMGNNNFKTSKLWSTSTAGGLAGAIDTSLIRSVFDGGVVMAQDDRALSILLGSGQLALTGSNNAFSQARGTGNFDGVSFGHAIAGGLVGVFGSATGGNLSDNQYIAGGDIFATTSTGLDIAHGQNTLSLEGSSQNVVYDIASDNFGSLLTSDYAVAGGVAGRALMYTTIHTNRAEVGSVISEISKASFLSGAEAIVGDIGLTLDDSYVRYKALQSNMTTNSSDSSESLAGGLIGDAYVVYSVGSNMVTGKQGQGYADVSALTTSDFVVDLAAQSVALQGANNTLQIMIASGNYTDGGASSQVALAGGLIGRIQSNGILNYSFSGMDVYAFLRRNLNLNLAGLTVQQEGANTGMDVFYGHGNVQLTEPVMTAMAGGLVGFNQSYIEDSFAVGRVEASMLNSGVTVLTGTVSLSSDGAGSTLNYYNDLSMANVVQASLVAGGLVGENLGGPTTSRTYSTGMVVTTADFLTDYTAVSAPAETAQNGASIVSSLGDQVTLSTLEERGGLLARGDGSYVIDSYWDTETSGVATSAGGTGHTTRQIQQGASLLYGWDTNIWTKIPDYSYPFLTALFGGASAVSGVWMPGSYDNVAKEWVGSGDPSGQTIHMTNNGTSGTFYSLLTPHRVQTGANGYYYYLLSNPNPGSLMVYDEGMTSTTMVWAYNPYTPRTSFNNAHLQQNVLTVMDFSDYRDFSTALSYSLPLAGDLNASFGWWNISGWGGVQTDAGYGLSIKIGDNVSDYYGINGNTPIVSDFITIDASDMYSQHLSDLYLSISNTIETERLILTGKDVFFSSYQPVQANILSYDVKGLSFFNRNSGFTPADLILRGTNVSQADVVIEAGSITLESGSSFHTEEGDIELAVRGAGKAFTNNGTAGFTFGTDGNGDPQGRFLIWSQDPSLDDRGGLAHDFRYYNANYGSTDVSGVAGNGFLYALAPQLSVTLNSVTKVYDRTTDAATSDYTIDDVVDNMGNTMSTGDVFDLSALPELQGSYNDKDAGTNKYASFSTIGALEDQDGTRLYGYTLYGGGVSTNNAVITPKAVTLLSYDAAGKVYDGNRNAVTSNYVLDGMISGDALSLTGVTALFDTKGAGTNKDVVISVATLDGADKDNYSFTIGTPTIAKASITPKTLTLDGSFTAQDKVYDGTTTAVIDPAALLLDGAILGDDVTLQAVGAFDTPNVGSGKTVLLTGSGINGLDAGNYVLSFAGAPSATASILDGGGVTPPAPGGIDHSLVEAAIREMAMRHDPLMNTQPLYNLYSHYFETSADIETADGAEYGGSGFLLCSQQVSVENGSSKHAQAIYIACQRGL